MQLLSMVSEQCMERCKWGLDVWEETQIPGAALHAFRYPNTFNHLAGVNMVQ